MLFALQHLGPSGVVFDRINVESLVGATVNAEIRLLIAVKAEPLDHPRARDRPFDEAARDTLVTEWSDLADLNRSDRSADAVDGIHGGCFFSPSLIGGSRSRRNDRESRE